VKITQKIRSRIKHLLPGHSPDFLIVGVQKAATTSLYYYLNQHPSIIGSRPKEVCYFDRDVNYEKGKNWYKHHFPNTRNPFGRYLYFEATPEYAYRKIVANRIYQFNPEIKIVMVLRDPVARAFSAWSMYRHFGIRSKGLPEVIATGYLNGADNNMVKEFYSTPNFPSFDRVIDEDFLKTAEESVIEEPSVVRRGIYYTQVKRYFDLFGQNNVLILSFKDVIGKNKINALNSVLELIGLPKSDWKFLKDEPKNIGKNKEAIPPLAKEKLELFYAPYNDQLFELLGFKPNW
jgi:hypothetical protein